MIGAAEVALLPRLRFALRPAALDVGRYARFAAFMEDQGLVESPPPVETYAVEVDGIPYVKARRPDIHAHSAGLLYWEGDGGRVDAGLRLEECDPDH